MNNNDYSPFNPAAPKAPLCRQLHAKASVPVELPGPVIDFRSSDETLDRYKERITVAGWRLENYRKNPVVQNAHSYCSLSDTIGKSLITEIRGTPDSSGSERGLQSAGTPDSSGPYLFQRIMFAVEENPMAKVAYGLYKGGFLSAVSVGFIPISWENGSQEKGYRRKYLQQELLEVSAVSIPANPNALTLALKAGALEKSDLKELFDLLRHFCAEAETTQHAPRTTQHEPPGPAPITHHASSITSPFSNSQADRVPDTSALGSAIDEARLLHLTKQMNEIRAILKRA